MNDITFITSNAAKAEQISLHLSHPVLHQKIDLPEIQSLDLREIVTAKAKSAFAILQKPVLVEDTSLQFSAMGKLPGPLIKWFLSELGNEGLCTLLDGYAERSAQAAVCFGLYDGNEVYFFEGDITGSITKAPRGSKGFGWDPIFIPAGQNKTWGEMNLEEQMQTSMRRQALQKLEAFLKDK